MEDLTASACHTLQVEAAHTGSDKGFTLRLQRHLYTNVFQHTTVRGGDCRLRQMREGGGLGGRVRVHQYVQVEAAYRGNWRRPCWRQLQLEAAIAGQRLFRWRFGCS